MHSWQFTVHNVQLTIHSSQCTVHSSQWAHSQPQNEQIECKILWKIASERNAEENMRKLKCRIIKKTKCRIIKTGSHSWGKWSLAFNEIFIWLIANKRGFARNCNSARGVHCETVKGLLVQANDDFFFEKRSKSCSADKVQQRAKGFSGLQYSGSLANQCYSLLCYMAVLQCVVLQCSVTVLQC